MEHQDWNKIIDNFNANMHLMDQQTNQSLIEQTLDLLKNHANGKEQVKLWLKDYFPDPRMVQQLQRKAQEIDCQKLKLSLVECLKCTGYPSQFQINNLE